MFEEAGAPTPPAELIRGLAVLAEPPTEEHLSVVEALGLSALPTPSDYSDVFLFQLYPYASVHLGPEGMMGGDAGARVAGFWRALGYEPPAEPDHLAALLGLYAALADAEGRGDSDGGRPKGPTSAGAGTTSAVEARAERRLVRESRHALLDEHLAPWIFAYLDRLRELTRGPYAEWATLLEAVLRDELGSRGERRPGEEDRLPLHLRAAPPLPDPRQDGAGAFVAGLLAPVRSGVILTRADLARIAARCDVGLRAGERRYALEHLLAQDGEGVLGAMAEEARRQEGLHRTRERWLSAVSIFMAERARATAELLEILARAESAGEVAAS